ncbi:N-formylglutamate amidohydrolase [Natronospirillum operosum]|uniref:N-formylglutamate amidohydrolase n=1 Tax=Natronospirillum operosum TaxID=2759953 RepID=A0A4Z0W7R1_9GAMM|nr:N-formylglutamate amidohydrolase [Natronospirillum operosum]
MQAADHQEPSNNSDRPAEEPWQGVVSYWNQDGSQVEAHAEFQASGLVLICEHASNRFDAPWDDLGLEADLASSHIAWDPGALPLARRLAAALAPVTGGTVLVHAPLSRLIYDLNRSPDQLDAMPAQSENYVIPGNQSLSPEQRRQRIRALYLPFHASVHAEIAGILAQGKRPLLLTIHSFTPVYRGQARQVELGVIHDTDDTLARAIVAAARTSHLDVRLNEPYSARDHVTHTLKLHATPYDLAHAMLEVRNDLLADSGTEADLTAHLTEILTAAFQSLGDTPCLDS